VQKSLLFLLPLQKEYDFDHLCMFRLVYPHPDLKKEYLRIEDLVVEHHKEQMEW